MKRNLIILFCILLVGVKLFSAPKKKESKVMYVAVEELVLKNKASITGRQCGSLIYGSRVFVTDEKGSWCKITAFDDDSITGWVNSGSLTRKKIIVASNTTTNADQLALAGKGSVNKLRSPYDDEEEEDTSVSRKVSTNASELSLAGKGFNSAVEAAYEDEFNVSFELVDAIEKNMVTEDDTIAFIEEGNLRLEN
ncbi:MAG: SH3 domain-containing protein [Treponema sp.]|nr:SH3 domain-containing protein [Treponema sp.]